MIKNSILKEIVKVTIIFILIAVNVRSACQRNRKLEAMFCPLFPQTHVEHAPNYLGHGSFGVVVKTKWAASDEPGNEYDVVVKKSIGKLGISAVVNEATVLEDLNRRNAKYVPKLYFCFLDSKGAAYLVTGYLPTSLATINYDIQDNTPVYKKFFDEGTVLQRLGFYRRLAVALEELHSNGYFHGDLKPDNLMLNGRVSELFEKDIVLIDLGSTRPRDYTRQPNGTPQFLDYQAELRTCFQARPYMLSNEAYYQEKKRSYAEAWKVDVWAFAATIYELENDRRGEKAKNAFYFMPTTIDCENIETNSVAKQFRNKVMGDTWLRDRGLDFKIGGQPLFKNLLDDMTKVMRRERQITISGIVERLTQIIDAYSAGRLKKATVSAAVATKPKTSGFSCLFCMGPKPKKKDMLI